MSRNKLQASCLFELSQFISDYFFKIKKEYINFEHLYYCHNHYLRASFINCPACLHNMVYLISFKTARHKELLPLFYCNYCGTMYTPQPEQNQIISNDNPIFSSLNNSLDDHLRFEERNRALAKTLFSNLNIELKSIIEVGCGPGWLLSEANALGIKTLGFDIATTSCNYGKEHLHLDIRNEFFSIDSNIDRFDLLVCIMVLEHLPDPDVLLFPISKFCKQYNSPALISVPISNDIDELLLSLLTLDSSPSSLFRYSPGHTNHFSTDGFVHMLKRFNAISVNRLRIPGSWPFLFLVHF